MSYADLHALLIPPHGLTGVVAMVAGLLALALPKRAGGHSWAGRSFMVAMALAVSLAAPVIFAGGNTFLMGMGLLVLFHASVAWRLARLKPPQGLPGPLDRALPAAFGLAFAIFVAYGARALWLGHSMGMVAVILGGVSLGSAVQFHRFLNAEAFEPGAWVDHHVRGVAAAYIASITAFAAATGPRLAPELPEILFWLGPSAVLTPVFVVLGGRYRR